MQRLRALFAGNLKFELSQARAFGHLVGGSAGRLVISLAYFVSIANSLTVADFGLFATASAVGVLLSRIAGFGFVSPLYRAATVKPRLIGVHTAGLGVAFLCSLPLVALVGGGFYLAVFRPDMALAAFAAVIAAEVLFWRPLEVVCIVNNGLGRFGRAAMLVILGTAIRALGAVGFALAGSGSLLEWSLVYMGANAVAAVAAYAFFYPRVRLRLVPRLSLSRWRDALSVAVAEVVFYLQSELDKLLVLSIGGPHIAGLYAILMRLVDLTALPVRAFNTMAVQRLMRVPDWLAHWGRRWLVEGGIAFVSIAGLAAIALLLHVAPNALGRNVADAAPLVAIALLVPAFRNIVEYHSELLYARGKTAMRALILALVGLVKAGLLSVLLIHADAASTNWIIGLNGLFFTLWLVSASATYTTFDWRERKGKRVRSTVTPIPQPVE
ncbi:lipopolysaccharide biosynthesis protein [Aureimonas psammosilenae]|uniref:lipopolysaccharide biosynthesis protein n=1 Tax=Aureimonas psammosilenae TaxID=2495496 RepID=UPI001260E87F|nr:lipopolysaccharide biosynthesis protein [Aureimonas psammosilenae]